MIMKTNQHNKRGHVGSLIVNQIEIDYCRSLDVGSFSGEPIHAYCWAVRSETFFWNNGRGRDDFRPKDKPLRSVKRFGVLFAHKLIGRIIMNSVSKKFTVDQKPTTNAAKKRPKIDSTSIAGIVMVILLATLFVLEFLRILNSIDR